MSGATIESTQSGTRSRGEAFRRAALLLALASVMALACAAIVLAVVLRADFLTGAAAWVTRVMFAHAVVAVAAAASPIFAALLVGYAYMQRGIRRRAAASADARARSAAAP